ncbi:MAG: hypothetical protein IPL39_07455 [Opitutaceae bacterium]|nr:hypothetical protein [Opitutaceae bacterium]
MKAPRYLSAFVVVALCSAGAWALRAGPADPVVAPPAPGASSETTGVTRMRHAVGIRSGPATPKVLTNALNHGGEPVPVACATCHTTRTPNLALRAGEDLKEFHQGLAYQHGAQSCLSCHNATNYDTLRRADGTSVDYPRVIELCAQCHGPQYRDFRAGAHGGMTGHWDLACGPRERNTCVDCHDPHAPAFPKVRPVFAPIDRGAVQQAQRAAAHPVPESRHE